MIDPKTFFLLFAIASGAIAWQSYWLHRAIRRQDKRDEQHEAQNLKMARFLEVVTSKLEK